MARLLLIGNSRWHWAEAGEHPWRCWHAAPPGDGSGGPWDDLQAWAAVGAVPPGSGLPAEARIGLTDIPLQGLPPWLGVDRALVGWRAWQQQGHGVLVADAGTALSLTRIHHSGCFRGGRISAGVALQLQALHGGTAQLPAVAPQRQGHQAWPTETEAAMLEGCRRSTAAAIVQAWRDLHADDAQQRWALWLTGGDAELLQPLLVEQQIEVVLAPDLALQALASLPVVGLQA